MRASRFSLSKNWCNIPRFLYNKGNGGWFYGEMEKRRAMQKSAKVSHPHALFEPPRRSQ